MAAVISDRALDASQIFRLHDVSWDSYVAMRAALTDRTAIRMTYDRGELELMNLSCAHERYKSFIGRLIGALTFELDIAIEAGGSMTYRRQDVERGLEPDECYWIAHEPAVRGRTDFDFEVDPPPDLAVEVDITNSSLDRHGIYAALGIPELWRFHKGKLTAYRLAGQQKYELIEFSVSFPFLRVSDLESFLVPDEQLSQTVRLRQFIDWVREQEFEV